MLTEQEQAILTKLKESVGGLGFAAFLAWASEVGIDNADVAIAPLVALEYVNVDYLAGMYSLV